MNVLHVLRLLCRWLVCREGAAQFGGHHGSQFGRFKHGEARAVGEDFLHEVGGDAHAVIEYGVFVVHYFALRMVQGQRTQVFGPVRVGLDGDALGFVVREHYPERIVEICLGVECRVGRERGGQRHAVAHAVEGIGLDFSVGRDAAGGIPALFENLEEIRLEHYTGGGAAARVGVIGEAHGMAVAYGFDYQSEVASRRWHVFKEDMPCHVPRIAEHVAYGHGVEQPVGDAFAVGIVLGYVVLERGGTR